MASAFNFKRCTLHDIGVVLFGPIVTFLGQRREISIPLSAVDSSRPSAWDGEKCFDSSGGGDNFDGFVYASPC
jgi:hypothetical protein